MAQYNFHIGDVVSSCVNSEREMTIVDINNDGIVDLTDLSKFAILLVDKCEFTSLQTKVADFDKDGVAGLTDLARLRQYISKVIENLVD